MWILAPVGASPVVVVVVVPGVGDVGGGGGGGDGLNFSRVHGFTYVSHYTGPRLSRRLGGYTSGHGSTDANSGHLRTPPFPSSSLSPRIPVGVYRRSTCSGSTL